MFSSMWNSIIEVPSTFLTVKFSKKMNIANRKLHDKYDILLKNVFLVISGVYTVYNVIRSDL